jgi:POT family proton-dependent oligopeptide transporter
MGSGLFVMMIPSMDVFELGLSLVIVGNGLFKPNISTMVGQLYAQNDFRRDAGFTIFYMGINAGSFISPLLTGWLASVITDTPMQQNYKIVFASAGVGMILSFLWFWFGRQCTASASRRWKGRAAVRIVWSSGDRSVVCCRLAH